MNTIQAPALCRVKVTKPDGLCLRLRHHAAGDVVEMSAEDAITIYQLGFADILAPHSLGELPERIAPTPDPEPFPEDVKVRVKVTKSVFWHNRSHSKGEECTLPERVAVKFVAIEAAKLLKDSQLSGRGNRFLRALLAKPGEKDFEGSNPAY